MGTACDPPGSVMRHPPAVAGTNSDVLGAAKIREADGAWVPSVRAIDVVHVNLAVSAEPSALIPMTRNVAEVGMVRHRSGPVMVPRSSDQ